MSSFIFHHHKFWISTSRNGINDPGWRYLICIALFMTQIQFITTPFFVPDWGTWQWSLWCLTHINNCIVWLQIKCIWFYLCGTFSSNTVKQNVNKESTVKIHFLNIYLWNWVKLESELLEEPLVLARLVPGNRKNKKLAYLLQQQQPC